MKKEAIDKVLELLKQDLHPTILESEKQHLLNAVWKLDSENLSPAEFYDEVVRVVGFKYSQGQYTLTEIISDCYEWVMGTRPNWKDLFGLS